MKPLDYTSHRELFAYELNRLRTQQGFSKSSFAVMVGVSRRHLIKLESAEASPTLEMMERLAAGLDVPVRDMVDFEAIGRRMEEGENADSDDPSQVSTEFHG